MRRAAELLVALCVVALVVSLCGCGGMTGTAGSVGTAGKPPPPPSAQYNAVQMPVPGWAYCTWANAVSEASGGVVWVGGGAYRTPFGSGSGAMLWKVTLGPPVTVTAFELPDGMVNGVNSRGEAVGKQRYADSSYHAFYWNGSAVVPLPEAGAPESEAQAVGEDPTTVRIAGSAWTSNGGAALWEFPVGAPPGQPTIFGAVDGIVTSTACGLCDSSQPLRVVGTLLDGGLGLPVLWERPSGGAVTATRLGTGGQPGDVNAVGQICGPGARVWQNGAWTQLPLLSGYASQSAYSLSDAGGVVGMAETAPKKGTVTRVAVRWQGGQVADLNTLVTGLPGPLYRAKGINNQGMIVADSSAAQRTYLLTPK
jgi:hypothetical protein